MKLWIKIDRPIDSVADIPLKDEAPEKVKKLYQSSNKGDFIFWIDDEEGTIGCIKNNRSISMCLDTVSILELQEMKPAKGRGYVSLCFMSKSGKELGEIYANQYSQKALNWLASIQPIIANEAGLEVRSFDYGFDA